jgi:glycosyltransferase involved in cell wall biosynthesis
VNILVVHNSYMQTGGEDRAVQTETTLLRRSGHKVFEYLKCNREIENYGLRKKAALGWRTTWSSTAFREILGVIDDVCPDVVHVHNTLPLISPSIYYACRRAGVAIVQTLHNYRLICPSGNLFRQGRPCEECVGRKVPWPGMVHGCYGNSHLRTSAVAGMLGIHRYMKAWSEVVDVYVALTEFGRRKFVEAGLPADRIVVKPNCVEDDAHERVGPGEYALYVGRLSQEKGLSTLLRAWESLSSVPLMIVGDGPLGGLVRSVANRRTGGLIRALGEQPREVVLDNVLRARFLVLPSECYEGFPLSLVEAFASGLPVIGSGHGAVAEVVDHGKTGLLFKPGDVRELVSTVLWAWSHPEEMATMGRNAREAYLARYSEASNYQQLLNIYTRAIGSSHWPSPSTMTGV